MWLFSERPLFQYIEVSFCLFCHMHILVFFNKERPVNKQRAVKLVFWSVRYLYSFLVLFVCCWLELSNNNNYYYYYYDCCCFLLRFHKFWKLRTFGYSVWKHVHWMSFFVSLRQKSHWLIRTIENLPIL